MHTALLAITSILLSAALIFAVIWIASFTLIVYSLKRKHPKYYKAIGEPAIDFLRGTAGIKRNNAGGKFLSELYKDNLPGFPKDKKYRKLADTYRHAMHYFLIALITGMPFLVILLLK